MSSSSPAVLKPALRPHASQVSPSALPFEQELRQVVRGEVLTHEVIRGIYATDASLYQQTPRVVVVPVDEADVVAAMKVAFKHKVPTTPRGGGTSLSGQTFGPGMVLDLSKHMDKVIEVNTEQQWARVQAGVIRDRLNIQLKPMGLHFTPDPATGNRAAVGGMVGNNTSGTRSVVYGKTIDNVISVRVALHDGTVADFEPVDDDEWQRRAAGKGVTPTEALIYKGVKDLINQYQGTIKARYPKVMRRVSGYNLDEFVDGAGYTGSIGPRKQHNQGHRTWNLANLVVGSEGTLAVLLDAKLRLIPLPKATALCAVHFNDLLDSLRAVDPMLEHDPSTIELLDQVVMREAKVNPATRQMAYFIEGDPAAVQLVEFMGDTPQEAQQRVDRFVQDMKQRNIGYAWPSYADAKGQTDVWETRKLGLGLISNVKGSDKGRDFIEDACVPTEHLAEYIRRIIELCKEKGLRSVALYAHASVGVIHVVPSLDLHDSRQVETMQDIAEKAFAWCMEFGGSWSGEHGDGQVRGQFLPRMFGEELYQAFRELKGIFDPHHLMNPGKLVDAPAMTAGLRYQQPGYNQRIAEVKDASHFHYRDQGGFALAVEQCNGVGACRKLGSGTMCPSYMATRDEKDTTRGRANALRLAMSGQLGEDPVAALGSDGVKEILDLCLACKACKSECPNAVDMAKLKSDVLQMRHDRRGTPIGYRLMGGLPEQARLFAGSLSWVPKIPELIPGYRVLFEKITGIDHRRPIPGFASKTLYHLLAEQGTHKSATDAPARGSVVLFNDTYATYMEPHVGLAAYNLLSDAGYDVILADAGCCQRPRLSKGLVREAKRLGTQTMLNLDRFAQQSLPIVCLEPSCATSLADDLPDLMDDEVVANRVAKQVTMIDVFLEREGVELISDAPEVLLHGHCHQKSSFGTGAIKRLFGKSGTTQCTEVDSGCCGMAGSFGYEHYDISKKVGEDRLFPAVRKAVAEGKAIVACGISCRHQLRDFLHVKAKHWVEVVKVKPGD
jgi:FAD/FMN-containing dehydrogenase/Fe-S oxidoreductase